jgi:carboxyl-terminal processing protease
MTSANSASFSPSAVERSELLSSIAGTVSARFYEPTVHGIDLEARFETKRPILLKTDCFSRDINAILSEIEAYPTEFFHESERRVGLWKTIGTSFFQRNGSWIFQDVLPNHLADRAGVRPGAELVAVDGVSVATSGIPKFAITDDVQIAFKNPGHETQTLSFNPNLRVPPNPTTDVTHRKLADKVGYLRISKWAGILGMEVARATDQAIVNLSRPRVMIVDIRGNLGSEGAGNLRLMGYLTSDKVPVGYSLTRRRAEQGYRREDLPQFTKIQQTNSSLH